MLYTFLVSSLISYTSAVVSAEENTFRITSASGLVEFSRSVINGMSFNGTTVYLDADVDFTEELSQQFKPIGNETNYFLGTFNGQGHTISNLAVNSFSSISLGFFGFPMVLPLGISFLTLPALSQVLIT